MTLSNPALRWFNQQASAPSLARMSRGGFRRLLNHGRPPVGKKMSAFRNLGESSGIATSFAAWFHALHRNQLSATRQSRKKLTSISAALIGADYRQSSRSWGKEGSSCRLRR